MPATKNEFIEGPKAYRNFERAMKTIFRAPKLKYKPKRRKAKPDKG
jgi:hypothetical protein